MPTTPTISLKLRLLLHMLMHACTVRGQYWLAADLSFLSLCRVTRVRRGCQDPR